MAALDWGILIVAGSSLIFAVIAYRQVMRTSGRINSLIDRLPKNLPKMVNPDFVADVLSKMITKDLKAPDGSPVTITDVMTGYMEVYGPRMMAHFDKHKAEYIPLLLNPDPTPQPGQSPGQALANQRWSGGGGLKAAKAAGKLAKVAGVSGAAGKIQQAAEVMGAVKELVPAIQDLRGAFGKGNGDNSGPSESNTASGGGDVWCPQ